ncbi:uncharacterized protein LOC118230212 [Anguilla anguilla]|uniref:uncharacterized protein LOC118230212 n=1 Tax=Anguilla anguilla TaxID=7936 RepID=UPI0015AA84A7|nr:uncharacterized protein LOC118230212 [Anguilla anguilla]
MDDTDNIENQALHLCEKDSAPPSPKRSKPNRETTNELFATEGGLENDGATQSCVLLTLQSDTPCGSYNSGRLSFSQSASQERETHVENALQESVTFSGLNSGCAETDCAAEEGPAQNRKQPSPGPGLFVTVGGRARLAPRAAHQKPESGNQEGLDETGLPYQCHHQSHFGGTLEAGYILQCMRDETPSANTFAMQRNSLEYIPGPYMPSYEAECGIISLETFAGMEENEVKNEDNKARSETDAEEDANICNTETRTLANVSFAADAVQYADDSSLNGITSDGNSENNDREGSADPEAGFPGGNPELAERERACFRAAAARTASACADHATGDGLVGSRVSQEPPDVTDVAAVIARTGAEQTEHGASGRRSPATAASPSDTAADEGTRCSDGRAPCAPRETDTGGCREGGAEAACETACEEWLGKDRVKIPEASIRLVPSSEVIPVINRIHKLDAPPSAEAMTRRTLPPLPSNHPVTPSSRKRTRATGLTRCEYVRKPKPDSLCAAPLTVSLSVSTRSKKSLCFPVATS